MWITLDLPEGLLNEAMKTTHIQTKDQSWIMNKKNSANITSLCIALKKILFIVLLM